MAETQNTGQFAKTIVTDVGKDMIAKSQNGQTLTFSRVALGDGLVGEEEDVTKFTAVKNERLSLPIAKYSNLGNGQFQIQFRLTNSQVESGFWHREIGIMAKIDNGQEQLYAYTTAGNKASFIYDKTTPVEERIVNVNFVIGNAQNLEVIINSSVIYATIEDLEEALDAHNAGADAHEPAFDAHNAADDAHKDFTGATAEAAGKRGMVPAPAAGDQNKALFGDASYKDVVTSVNDIMPSDGNVDINRKFYNSLAQLGLEYTTVTYEQIVNALPVNSTLTFYADIVTSAPTYCPNLNVPVSGLIIVTKGANNTIPIDFHLTPIGQNVALYTGKYTTYNSYGFSGWIAMPKTVNGVAADYTGNIAVTPNTYSDWNWTNGNTTINGFVITFTSGFRIIVWYLLFPSGTNQLTVTFPVAFNAAPIILGTVQVVTNASLVGNVVASTATNCTLKTNDSGPTATYWVAFGYAAS